MSQTHAKLNPMPGDEMRQTTCYMCACRCGINVHLRDGKVSYIEGNRNHPVNKGVLCAKGSSGIKQVTAPSRLSAPMKRVGPRGSGEFETISWDEALDIATKRLQSIRQSDPKKLAFFTGRDQSQSLTSLWAQMFGTPNYASHGGFCSVNMATAGIYTMGGAFWEFGQPDWERSELFMIFGVAEDHDSNPIKMGLGKLKSRGAKIIGVNPIRSGYNAIADEWVAITPGTDGLFILSLIRELILAGKIDFDYLANFTNAPALVNVTEGSDQQGMLLRANDKIQVVDRKSGKLADFDKKGVRPDLTATLAVDGNDYETSFSLLVKKYSDEQYAPENIAHQCGISAEQVRSIARQIAEAAFDKAFEVAQPWTDFRGEKHEKMIGRPVSFHAMRGISAHSNGFQTCRALHILQILVGSVETPGGFRFKPPYPKPATAHPKPHCGCNPGSPLNGPHLGFVHRPADLLIEDSKPVRIDKAFTWENPFSAHGLMHMLISNAHAGDPYPIDTLFLYMANMAWNSSMDIAGTIHQLTDKKEDGEYVIPYIIYSDAYASEMVAYADLILPDTTYLERHDCISLLDRPICEADAIADAIRWPVIEPDREVRGFQSVIIDLANRLELENFTKDGKPLYEDYADYMVNHQRREGVGPLIGFRGKDANKVGRGEVNPDQLNAYIENGGFFASHIPDEALFYKPWNKAYQEWAVSMGIYDAPQPYLFDIYLESLQSFRLAAMGFGEHQPPDELRERILKTMSPLPEWYSSLEGNLDEYPHTALTQRPMAMYHSWGSQNEWLRQLHTDNKLYIPTKIWKEHGFKEGDWAKVSSRIGAIEVPVAHMQALNDNTMWTWNAIGKRGSTWGLTSQANEAQTGFLLNHLIDEHIKDEKGKRWSNADPITGQAAWFDLRVKIERVEKRSQSAPHYPEIRGVFK